MYYNDTNVTTYNLAAVLQWFQKFENFQKNSFYISGESYAGIYIPYLATAILDYNNNLNSNFKINLKGIAIGNGVTFYNYDYIYGYPTFMYGRGLVSPLDWTNLTSNGCLNSWDSNVCQTLINKITAYTSNIYSYYIYADCQLSLCPDQQGITSFLNILEVQVAINAIEGGSPLRNWKVSNSVKIKL